METQMETQLEQQIQQPLIDICMSFSEDDDYLSSIDLTPKKLEETSTENQNTNENTVASDTTSNSILLEICMIVCCGLL